MPVPLVLGIGAAIAGVGGIMGGINGSANMKKADETMKDAKLANEMNLARLKERQDETAKITDVLGKKELEILGNFKQFSQISEKIQNRPAFKTYDKNGVKVAEYSPEELKNVSAGADALLGGIGGATIGTAGGFAAAGAATAAIIALGTASTGAGVSGLSGVAATSAKFAFDGWRLAAVGETIAAGGGGAALGSAGLLGVSLGVGLLAGGIILSAVGSSRSNKANKALRRVKTAEEETDKICKHLKRLDAATKRYHEALVIVEEIYTQHLNKLYSIVETDGKKDWNDFSDEEKRVTENTALLAGLLFSMCKVRLVLPSGIYTKTNRINMLEINKSIENANTVLSERGLAEDALAELVLKPIMISSIIFLRAIGTLDAYPLDGYYELVCDIDASGSKKGTGFEPIGTQEKPFTGTLEGNDFTINRLFINRGQSDAAVGLFGVIGEEAQINGVNIDADVISGKDDVGVLIGVSHGCVTNCNVSGILSGNERVGGLVGKNLGSIGDSCSSVEVNGKSSVGGLVGVMEDSGTVTGCYSTGKVCGDGSDVGGLVGDNNGNITDSYTLGEISGKDRVGSLVGSSRGTISQCYSTGKVCGNEGVGGLAGITSGDITDSYSSGEVRGKNYIGGLVGSNSNPFGSSEVTTISQCYSTGKVCGNDHVGGLVGNNRGNITDSYSSGEVSGKEEVGGLVGNNSGNITDSYSSGEVSGKEEVGGLVGITGQGVFNDKDISISQCHSTGKVNGETRVGGLVGVGRSYSGGINNVNQSYSTGEVNGKDHVGGLVGYFGGSSHSIITQCYSTGEVTGKNNVGGLLGCFGGPGIISQCYSMGKASGERRVGGLVGSFLGYIYYDKKFITLAITHFTITQCYSTGEVTGKENVGGLVGYTNGFTNKKTFTSYMDKITDCYWDTATSKIDASQGGKGKSTTMMQLRDLYENWDFEKVWQIDESKGYPTLQAFTEVPEPEPAETPSGE